MVSPWYANNIIYLIISEYKTIMSSHFIKPIHTTGINRHKINILTIE